MHYPLLSTTIIKEDNNTRSDENFSNHLGVWFDGRSSYLSTWRGAVRVITLVKSVCGIIHCRHVVWGWWAHTRDSLFSFNPKKKKKKKRWDKIEPYKLESIKCSGVHTKIIVILYYRYIYIIKEMKYFNSS